MPDPFKEDFFERVVNVHWEDEPEVYWIAGTGYMKVLGAGFLFTTTFVGLSDDGLSWALTDITDKYNSIECGGWMRENLLQGAPPVWVLLGSKANTGDNLQATSTYSTDGSLPLAEQQPHDKFHMPIKWGIKDKPSPPSPANPKGLPGTVAFTSQRFNAPPFEQHIHTSADGKIWKPQYFHDPNAISLVAPSSELTAAIGPELLADGPQDLPVKGDQRIFVQGSSFKATGKIFKGKYAGRIVTMEVDPIHTNPGASVGADTHGHSTLKMTDAKTGEFLGRTDCGIPRTAAVAYGHYVFCVGGQDGDPENYYSATTGIIAYTEDGITWGQTKIGRTSVTTFAVGPRK